MPKNTLSAAPLLVRIALIGLLCFGGLLIFFWAYTTVQLNLASKKGVYPSAEEAMQAVIARSFIRTERYEIIYAGTNSFDGSSPQVWYVIACVWGGTRLDGSPVGSTKHDYDQPGTFFLHTRRGWVHMPEGALPEVIGFWMQVFDLSGPGLSTPSHDWGSGVPSDCTF